MSLTVLFFYLSWVKCSSSPHLVVSKYMEDTNWASVWPGPMTICTHGLPNGPCNVPLNKGAESSAYLLFILLNWSNLPSVTAFVDAKERSWHQRHNKVECALNANYRDYSGINDLKIDTAANPTWDYERFCEVWVVVVQPYMPRPCPKRIITDGSGQFVVTKEAITRNNKSLYESLYNYTVGLRHWPGDHNWKDKVGFTYSPGGPKEGQNKWVGGVFFIEWIWGIIFTHRDMHWKKTCR